MKLENPTAKPEVCIAPGQSRYALHYLSLRCKSERFPGKGELAATDGCKLIVLPVEVEPHDTDGFITADALKAARKAGRATRRHGGIVRIVANGSQAVYDRPAEDYPEAEANSKPPAVTMPRPTDGEFPKLDAVIPSPFDDEKRTTVGLNAEFLAELQEALGASSVILSFARRDDGTIDPACPILVTSGRTRENGVGVLVPVQIGD